MAVRGRSMSYALAIGVSRTIAVKRDGQERWYRPDQTSALLRTGLSSSLGGAVLVTSGGWEGGLSAVLLAPWAGVAVLVEG
jgi:hypothetical protein